MSLLSDPLSRSNLRNVVHSWQFTPLHKGWLPIVYVDWQKISIASGNLQKKKKINKLNKEISDYSFQ